MPERPSEFRQRGETIDDWRDRLRRVDPDAGDDVDGFSKLMAERESRKKLLAFAGIRMKPSSDRTPFWRTFRTSSKNSRGFQTMSLMARLRRHASLLPRRATQVAPNGNPLRRNLKLFMGFVVRFGVPPGSHDAAVSDSCLAQYRDVLMFWVSRSYRLFFETDMTK
ncbi:hypothetical protein CGCA056_v012149 [Colletotrichum aenigma]|uniref:uncharacterized protein n=1 Tax=Colletotrichum aenigma TaxID=1215731 RepID=UPI001872D506|nr:uncharacterized protein CGCA056_v012149 [Colletotrichum aenigma]KAF5511940.1 hypothetical protein CGCA056_v012149 [Colletotrichum aenigma]